MIEKPFDTDFGCQEYCEPVHKSCLDDGQDEEHCQEKRESCMSFCEFA